MTERTKTRLIHGGHKGTEAEFGRCAEAWGVEELTLSFEGHKMERASNVEVLTESELEDGDVSMTMVCERLGRRFARGQGIRRVLQSMFHVVNRSDYLYAVGVVQPDLTVRGGTGWGVELAKFYNRGVSVYDQETDRWVTWQNGGWVEEEEPVVPDATFSATGTRHLTDFGRQAIHDMFKRSFGGLQTPPKSETP